MIFSIEKKANLENMCSADTHSLYLQKAFNKNDKSSIVQEKNAHLIQKIPTNKNLTHLANEYKACIQNGPAMGVYVLPALNDFFSWEFYLFLTEGCYKDAKLKGEIKFGKGQVNEVVSLNFLTAVFHPFVDYSCGKVDLAKLFLNESRASNQILGLFSALKGMFTDGQILKVQDSLNAEAAKTYKKSETLFIEKVFETTVIPSNERLTDQLQEGSGEGFINGQIFTESYRICQGIKEKLRSMCPNQFQSPQLSDRPTKENEESAQIKAQRLLHAIMNPNFHFQL